MGLGSAVQTLAGQMTHCPGWESLCALKLQAGPRRALARPTEKHHCKYKLY
jgi:hypothetical protein